MQRYNKIREITNPTLLKFQFLVFFTKKECNESSHSFRYINLLLTIPTWITRLEFAYALILQREVARSSISILRIKNSCHLVDKEVCLTTFSPIKNIQLSAVEVKIIISKCRNRCLYLSQYCLSS